MNGEKTTVISDGNWISLKLLTIGILTITFEGGFSNGSKENDDVTNKSVPLGHPIGWDYETRYDLLILPSHPIYS